MLSNAIDKNHIRIQLCSMYLHPEWYYVEPGQDNSVCHRVMIGGFSRHM
jgi:hypothetical protein